MRITLNFCFVLFFSSMTMAGGSLPNLRQVNENIFRSGRPTYEGLANLKNSNGLRTIINLDDNGSSNAQEETWAQQLGIKHIYRPINSFSRPKDNDINEVLELLNNPDSYPVLVHCMHGEDRTGMVIGLYRVFTDGWTPKAAYKEMLDLGFHPILAGLDRYFKDRTGYQKLAVPLREAELNF